MQGIMFVTFFISLSSNEPFNEPSMDHMWSIYEPSFATCCDFIMLRTGHKLCVSVRVTEIGSLEC